MPPTRPATLYRCSFCGLFYSLKTVARHFVCQAIEDRDRAGQP